MSFDLKIDDKKMQEFFSDLVRESEKQLSYVNMIAKTNHLMGNEQINYATMRKNLNTIYGKDGDQSIKLCLFNNVLAFIRRWIPIEGLERLFSRHYYDIEWNMYLENDFEKGSPRLYRDHFIHQIRDAYLGYQLLWGEGYKLINSILELIENNECGYFSHYINENLIKENKKEETEMILFQSWFIASLFHDIGYPIAYSIRSAEKYEQYMPYLRVLDQRSQTDFIELYAILADSYLFRMVDKTELEILYNKHDHGMLSAVCLLLNYYYTGTINRIEKSQRSAIELAAYSICVHTRKYAMQDNFNGDIKHYRPVYMQDPLAYLLRVCDDLQEWQRTYFLVGSNTNDLACGDCGQIIENENLIYYKCKCGHTFEKITSFPYQKINRISVCDFMLVEVKERRIHFSLNYNLYDLLNVLKIDEDFVKYRRKELKGLEKLLENQAYLPSIVIDYFLSNNVILIKAEIFRKFLFDKKCIGKKWTPINELYGQEKLISDELKLLKKNIKLVYSTLKELGHFIQEKDIDKIFGHFCEFMEERIGKCQSGEEIEMLQHVESPEIINENLYIYSLIIKNNDRDNV